MSYIEDDEFIVAVDYDAYYGNGLTDDDLCRLRDAGVRSVIGYVLWCNVEPKATRYSWTYLDQWTGRVVMAGLKPILSCYDYAPPYFADDWYLTTINGHIHRDIWKPRMMESGDVDEFSVLTPWNEYAWERHLDFIRRVCARYHRPGCLVISAGPVHGGEMVLPWMQPAYYDRRALHNFRRWMLEHGNGDQLANHNTTASAAVPHPVPHHETMNWLRDSITRAYVSQFAAIALFTGEVWTQFHHAFEIFPWACSWMIDDIQRAIREEVPSADYWGACYTVYRPGVGAPWSAERDLGTWHMKMLVGAEGPGGLRQNTPKAIASGFRGFLMAPLLPYGSRTKTEPWMFDEIAWCVKEWTLRHEHQ